MYHLLRPPLRTRWLASLACSSVAHALLAALVAAELLYAFWPADFTLQSPSVVLEIDPASQETTPPLEQGDVPVVMWMAASARDVSDLVSIVDDPRWQEALLEAHDQPANPFGSADFVTSELLRSIAAAEEQSNEANLDRLEELSDQLTIVSTEESVAQVTAALKGWFGTSERATRPADEPVAGEFDFSTAQLHDVLRDDSVGEARYTAVLLDAAGRTVKSELTAAEGESIYRVMQLMKDNPLLERVYRGIVLSLLDKLIGESSRPKAESGLLP